MATKLSDFQQAIANGVTLLFVSDKAEQMRAEHAAALLGLSCCSTRWMGQMSAYQTFSQLFNVFDRILIARAGELAHGLHVRCHRVVWAGHEGDPGSQARAVFAQSLARALPFHDSAAAPDRLQFAEVPVHD